MVGLEDKLPFQSRWGQIIPSGSWSDDTSMTVSAMETITKDKGEIKMLLTSNVELVKRLNRVVPPITPIPTDNDDIFKCKAKNMVLTWNIPFNKFASIHGSKWQIMNFITIKKENVELLHEALNSLIIIRKENLPT